MSVGHGGQVLLSSATESLVRDGLPEGCALVGLVEHRLPDLGRAEVLFLGTSMTMRGPPWLSSTEVE
jgi:hypothetical protein